MIAMIPPLPPPSSPPPTPITGFSSAYDGDVFE